jgi:flavin-dependent dehydrogenase
MKYDLIVAGGGPAGLMAAKTAAEDGLKVLLLERKKEITRITRDCAQIFYIGVLSFDRQTRQLKPYGSGYAEPVSVEILFNKYRFHFLGPGFQIDYSGPMRAFYNRIFLSPSGYRIFLYPPNETLWGFFYDKEAFTATLLASAVGAGAEIVNETMVLGASNTNGGVEVRARRGVAEVTYSGHFAIAADGRSSRIVESLGLNKSFPSRRPRHRLSLIMEGVEAPFVNNSYFTWLVPSVSPTGNIGMSLYSKNCVRLGVGSSADKPPSVILEEFMKLPTYRPWFAKARVVGKLADGTIGRPPIMEPVIGKIILVGDAAAISETFIQGAVACGYKAVKAIEKELNGEQGFEQYTAWWQKAFRFKKNKSFEAYYPLNRVKTDEEMDFLFSLHDGVVGAPPLVIGDNLDIVNEKRPDLYQRLIAER